MLKLLLGLRAIIKEEEEDKFAASHIRYHYVGGAGIEPVLRIEFYPRSWFRIFSIPDPHLRI
jgi:hypothetical protein